VYRVLWVEFHFTLNVDYLNIYTLNNSPSWHLNSRESSPNRCGTSGRCRSSASLGQSGTPGPAATLRSQNPCRTRSQPLCHCAADTYPDKRHHISPMCCAWRVRNTLAAHTGRELKRTQGITLLRRFTNEQIKCY